MPLNSENKICNVCGKPYEFALAVKYLNGIATCEHDNPDIGLSKLEKQRKQNRLASEDANRLAVNFAANQPKEETVRIEPKYFNDGKKRQALDVPKKVVANIEKDIKERGVENILKEINQ